MRDTVPSDPAFFDHATFLPRVTQHDGRAIEQALAAPTLFDRGVRLHGAVVEATFAAQEPPLVERLREKRVPQIVDPQTLRFTGRRYMTVERLRALPYAPEAPIDAVEITPGFARNFAREVMRFEDRLGAACYVAAALPYADHNLQAAIRANDMLLAESCAANGAGELARRPLIAVLAPGRVALAHPELLVNRLLDHPVRGVYVQSLRLNPVRDGLEKLAQYVRFLQALRAEGFPVIAGRVGAFGLVLQALGIPCFDSGLNQAEAFDLAQLNRPLTDRELERRAEGKTAGAGRRLYLEPIRTTVKAAHAEAIFGTPALRSRFVCARGCCRLRGFEDLLSRRRQHYLWVREEEVAEVREQPTAAMRLDLVHEWLSTARENGAIVRRTLAKTASEAPSFDHLDRWIDLLARERQAAAAA